MKINYTNIYYYKRIVLVYLLFFISLSSNAQDNSYNFSSFSNATTQHIADWQFFNTKQNINHPELGVLPEKAPCTECVEILDKRTSHERFFKDIKDTSKVYLQKSYGTFNEKINGRWVSIKDKLAPIENNIYSTRYSVAAVAINTHDRVTSIKDSSHTIQFNNWLLKVKQNGHVTTEQKADWSNITVGEDGAYITNIFYGIDAEMIVMRGTVKTNFIIKENKFGSFDELIFEDRYDSHQPVAFSFSDGTPDSITNFGKVTGSISGDNVVEINTAHAYVENNETETFAYMPYLIRGNTLSVIVPFNYININLPKGHIIIDPLVTSSATLAQTNITGSKYSAVCYTKYCAYDLTVPSLVNAVITDVKYSFNYYATAPCSVDKGAYTIHIGTCRAPNLPNFFKCNLPNSGLCIANDISIYSSLNNCINEFYCLPTNLEFQLRFYRCQDNTSGCGTDCIKAASDWVITLVGEELQREPPTLSRNVVCQNDTVTGHITFNNAMEPINHVWSLSANGNNPIGTDTSPVLTLNVAGTYPIYVKSTDACGNEYLDSVMITVQPTYQNIENDTACALSMPYAWHGQIFYTGGNNIATYNDTTIHGCDSNTILNLYVIPIIYHTQNITICNSALPYSWNGNVIYSGGYGVAKDTSISFSTGCDSITTLNLIIAPQISAFININICNTELPYTWNGLSFSTGGYNIASDTTISTSTGCDSITKLNLIVHTPTTTSITQHICNGGSYNYFGNIYTTTNTDTFLYSSIYGCDSTIILNIIKDPKDTLVLNESVCPGASYNFNGTTITNEGTYYQLGTSGGCNVIWQLNLSYYDTLFTYASYTICAGDSIVYGTSVLDTSGVYSFYGVNATGCDTMHTINLEVLPIDTTEIPASICPLEYYVFNGDSFNIPGTYYYTDTATPCIEVYKLVITEKDTIFTNQYVYLCSGDSYAYNGNTLDSAGNYSFTGINTLGCDTVNTIHLYIDPPYNHSIYETVCANNGFQFFDTTIYQSGVYHHLSTNGCDTMWNLYLTVIDTFYTNTYITICDGSTYTWQGINYTTAGTYNLAGINLGGCDTLHTIYLSVTPMDTVDISDSFCTNGNFYFYNQPITGSGVYVYIDTSGACDTVRRLTATLFDTINTSYTDSFCTGEQYTWAGVTYISSGVYNLFGVNANGCDTIHTLNLWFSPVDTVELNATICSGNSYTAGTQQYDTSGTYFWTNTAGLCDTVYKINLTVEDTIRTNIYDTICQGLYVYMDNTYFTTSGTYTFYGQNAQGCDTLCTLYLTVNPIITDSTFATICPGDSFNFYGIYYSQQGVYTRSSITEGCDTAYILTLTVPVIPSLVDSFTICANDSIVHDGVMMNTSGVYPFNYTSVDGCDSVYTIVLNVIPYIVDSIADTVCANTPYVFYDSTILAPGIYTHLTVDAPCDTLHVLSLYHLPYYYNHHQITYCNNQLPAVYLGITIPSNTQSMNNFDSVSLTSTNGCDSIIVIDLTINDTDFIEIDTTLCYGTIYQVGNTTISSSGDYTLSSLTNAHGCDSIVVIHVIYTPPPITQDTFLKACGTVMYNGNVFYNDTMFTDTFQNSIGCDSVYRDVIIEVPYIAYDTLYKFICQGDSFLFNGKVFYNSTIYTDTIINDNGCDSFITLNLLTRPLPNVTLQITPPLDNIECVLDTVLLQGNGALMYKFYDQNFNYLGEDDNMIISRIYKLNENLFYIIGTDEFGCIDTGSAVINGIVCCEMKVPNAFSPNGDGINDGFAPVTYGNPTQYRMQIFDRYGNQVYTTTNIYEKWNGHYPNGKPADIAVYFYHIIGICFDGKPFEYKGDVTLLR